VAGSTVRRSLGGGLATDLTRGQAGREPRRNSGTAAVKPSQPQQPAAGLAPTGVAEESPILRNVADSDGDSETAVLEALPPSLSHGLKRKRSAPSGPMAKLPEAARAGSTAGGGATNAAPEEAEAASRSAAGDEGAAVQHGSGAADAAAAAEPSGSVRTPSAAAPALAASTVRKENRRKRNGGEVVREDPATERAPAAEPMRVGGHDTAGEAATAPGRNGANNVVSAAAAERAGEERAFHPSARPGAADAASRKKQHKANGGVLAVVERDAVKAVAGSEPLQTLSADGAHVPLKPAGGATGPLAERPAKRKRKESATNRAHGVSGGLTAAPACGAAVAIHTDGPAWRDHAKRSDIRSGRYSEAEKQTIRDAVATCAHTALRGRAGPG
jgi:hypothetical protein